MLLPAPIKSTQLPDLARTELVKQIRSRFKIDEPVLRAIEFLLPYNAIQCNPPSLYEVYSAPPYFEEISDKSHADLEWRQQALKNALR